MEEVFYAYYRCYPAFSIMIVNSAILPAAWTKLKAIFSSEKSLTLM